MSVDLAGQFAACLQRPGLRAMLEHALAAMGRRGFTTNYVGINYSPRGIESLKFYFLTTARPDPDSLAGFFPHHAQVAAEYARYEEAEGAGLANPGITFALKVAGDGSLAHTLYLHRRGVREYFPAQAGLPVRELSIRDDFDVREFAAGAVTRKHYFFASDRRNVAFLLDRFGVTSVGADSVAHVEYAEFSGQCKMVMVIPDEQVLRQAVAAQSCVGAQALFAQLHDTLGWVPDLPGTYAGSPVRALYFFDGERPGGFFSRARTVERLLAPGSNSFPGNRWRA